MKKISLLIAAALLSLAVTAQSRWSIEPDGKTLRMEIAGERLPHYDHMEMSGEQISFVLRWAVSGDGSFSSDRSLVFPMLRTIPNNTHGSLIRRFSVDIPSLLSADNLSLVTVGTRYLEINGAMRVVTRHRAPQTWKGDIGSGPEVEITRTVFPSADLPLMCERYEVRNTGDKSVVLSIPEFKQVTETPQSKGVAGIYVVRCDIIGSGEYILQPDKTAIFDAVFQAYAKNGGEKLTPDVESEYAKRMSFIDQAIDGSLILETPDRVLDTGFRYAKIRGAESIYKTRGGYIHGPGGERYYAAIWANDQAEYINPFFPMLGYGTGNESAMNSFRHWYRFMNDRYEPLPSSIIAEGDDIWAGAGDRGDAAMIAYGASRYALAKGDRAEAEELWKLIEWCLEYCARKVNGAGVVSSDCDELENRFPAGDANLCTSALYYDALISAGYLGGEIGIDGARLEEYRLQSISLREAIENHFGADVSGYRTYRYYDGNTVLRSWICMPLIVGIYDRSDETVRALFGPELYTSDGCLTAEGSTTFWDRSTLYAFRGAYAAGHRELATEQLKHYTERRLLGDHVPYPIEAWPEGNQRHLSAESGLYCRVVTEGLFGIRPTGLRSFRLTPQLPDGWNTMKLRHVRAFGGDFDIEVLRKSGDELQVSISCRGAVPEVYSVRNGETIEVSL